MGRLAAESTLAVASRGKPGIRADLRLGREIMALSDTSDRHFMQAPGGGT